MGRFGHPRGEKVAGGGTQGMAGERLNIVDPSLLLPASKPCLPEDVFII